MNLGAVRTGIKTALSAVTDLQVYDYEALHPQLSAAVVGLPQLIDMRQVFDDKHWLYSINVLLLVGLSDDSSADNALEALVAEDGTTHTSAIVALRADETLGGTCEYAEVVTSGPFGMYLDSTAIGGPITLEIST